MTQEQLAAALDITRQTVYQWERGEVGRPRNKDVLKSLLDFFNVTEQELLGYTDGIQSKGLAGIPAHPFTKTAPVAGRIAAGDPRVAIELTDERRGAPADLVNRYPQGFFLRVTGDSMDKVFPDGAFVFINGVPDEVHTGDIAAVKVNGDDATIKRVQFFEGVVILVPESTNPVHKRRIIDAHDPDAPEVRVLGRAMWVDYSLVNF